LARHVVYEDGIEPTDLYPKREQVERQNANRLASIKQPTHSFPATDTPGVDEDDNRTTPKRMDDILQKTIAPKMLTLKVGAQVMLIKNVVQGVLVNGSMGQVVGFSTVKDAIRNNVKLALWHEFEDPDTHEDENTQNKTSWERKRKRKDKDKHKIPDWLLSRHESWPIVKFQNGHTILCVPHSFEVNNAAGGVEAVREQVPLMLAWALSIHKSQGQTLERVRVDLGRIFEKGQAYVALSRATSLGSLEVYNFDPGKIMAHPRVLAWMDKINSQKCTNMEDEMDFNTTVDEDLDFWEGYI